VRRSDQVRRLRTCGLWLLLLAGVSRAAAGEPAEVREPLFAALLAIADGDSLGVWDGAALAHRVAASGRRSRLPLGELLRVERREARPGEAPGPPEPAVTTLAAAGAASALAQDARRVWEITFARDLRLPMPYSILGYHPGTLLIARTLVAAEWRVGERNLRVTRGEETTVHAVTDIVVLRFLQGHLVLDADGWLDRLLGDKLDDSWTDGLLVCRHAGERRALALGRNRALRNLTGEFDFRRDKVLPNGSPLARGLGRFARPCVTPRQGEIDRAWAGVD
jgi:hypothetical protein